MFARVEAHAAGLYEPWLLAGLALLVAIRLTELDADGRERLPPPSKRARAWGYAVCGIALVALLAWAVPSTFAGYLSGRTPPLAWVMGGCAVVGITLLFTSRSDLRAARAGIGCLRRRGGDQRMGDAPSPS